jgi:hypothetical protein
MAHPPSPLQPPYAGLVPTIDEERQLDERHRNSRRRLREALRHVAGALSRAVSAALTSAGADTALLLSAESSWMLPVEKRLQAASLPPSVIEPRDAHDALGELLYPECPGAVMRFTAAMAGTHFMADYPWSPERGWVARN